MADARPQYQSGTGTIGGLTFHWGSGHPGEAWSIPYGDYPVTPDAPKGAWAQGAGAIPVANNVIPDPQLGRDRIGIMIHSGSGDDLDKLYTAGCFRVAQSEWPAVRQEILSEAKSGPLYLHVAPGGVAAFTNTPTYSPASAQTPAANANAAANTAANPQPSGTTINAANAPVAGALARPTTPTPGPTLFAGVNPNARGMKNNNPGNLSSVSDWVKGLPGYKGSDGKFAIFDTPENGAAALDRNLTSYGSKGINTPFGIASTWAPASDNNNPTSYGAQIAKALGVGPNDKIDMSDPGTRAKIANAIALVENGPGDHPGIKTNMSMFASNQAAKSGATTVASNAPAPTADGTAPAAAAPAAAPADQSWWSKLTTPPTDAQGNPTGAKSPLQELSQASIARLGSEGQTEKQEAPQTSALSSQGPGARNVSPGLANVAQVYGQTLNSFSTPLTWTHGAQGQPGLAAAGLRAAPPPVPGLSLATAQPLPQGLGYGINDVGYGFG